MQRVIFFDLGNVIVSVNKPLAIRAFAERTGIQPKTLAAAVHSKLEMDFEKGLLSDAEYLRRIHTVYPMSRTLTLRDMIEVWKLPFTKIDAVCDLLPVLQQQAKLCLLSNTNYVHFSAIREKYAIDHWFDDLILSYEVGCRKPDPQIYQKALRQTGTRAGRAIFIDDLAENVRAAEDLGIRSHLFRNIAGLLKFLTESGYRIQNAT